MAENSREIKRGMKVSKPPAGVGSSSWESEEAERKAAMDRGYTSPRKYRSRG
jgi:hypothetical protein